MEDYLPPIVTKLKGDWSDLRAAFLESRAAAKAWAVGIKEDIVSGLRNAGHQGGLAFADALKATTAKELLEGFDEDIGRKLGEQARKAGRKAGMSAAEGLIETFKGMFMPALIATVVMFTPMIGTAIASAITLGIGLGFIGLGAFLLRQQPALIAAATAFKETVAGAFKDAAAPLLGPLVAALGILGNGLKGIAGQFKEIFAVLGGSGAIQNLAGGVVGFLREMMPGLKELAPVMASLVSVLGTSVLPDIGKGLSGMFSELAQHGPEMVQFLKDFGSVLGDILPMVGTLLGTLATLYQFFEHDEFGKGLGLFGGIESWIELWPKIVVGAKAAWEWIKKVGAAVGEWVSGKAGKVADWWNGLVDGVKNKGKAVLDWFEALPGRIGAFLSALPVRLSAAAGAAFDAFFFTIGFATVKILQFVDTLPQRLSMWAGMLWLNVQQRFTQGVTDAEQTVRGWAHRLPMILDGLWHQFLEWGKKTWETVTHWAAQTVTDVVNWWFQLPGRIGGIVGSVAKTVKDWATGAVKWLYDAGKDMVTGLVNGAVAATDGAIAAIKRAIQRIIDGAKKALGIASPSTVFAEMGKFSMLGFMQGMQGERGMLARAWAGLAPTSPVVAAASPAMAYAAAGGGGDDRPLLVQLFLDGDKIDERLIERAQRRKARTGVTGYA